MSAYPTKVQTNRILNLVWELHLLVGRSCAEVMGALLATKTMARLGYRGTGRIETYQQAKACIQILERWVEEKRREHQQG